MKAFFLTELIYSKIMIGNPFAILDKAKEQISLDEAWDKELESIRENRIRYNSFIKEREEKLSAERKKKNPGDN